MRAPVVLTASVALLVGIPAPRSHAGPGTKVAGRKNNRPSASRSQEFLGEAKNLSITNLNVLAIDALQNDRNANSVYIDSLLYRQSQEKPALNLSREQFYEVVRRQRRFNDSMRSDLEIFTSFKPVAEGIADLGGPVGAFAWAASDTYMDRVLEKLRQAGEEAQRDEAKQFFAGRKLDRKKLASALSAGPATFAKEVQAEAGLPEVFDDLPSQQRELALVRLGEFTLGAMALQGQEFQLAQQANTAEFKRLRDRVAHIEDCEKYLAGRMVKLMEDTEENTKQLGAISNELSAQHQDLGLIQRVMFGHLSVDEELELVKSSKTLDLTDTERKNLEDNLTRRKRLLDSARQWNKFVHTGEDLLGIGDKLGVDKDVIAGLQKGLAASNSLYNAVNAAIDGNYIAAVTAVFGIFGGGGMDAETAHYEAIMGKLDEIIETQKKIIAIQQAILKELGRIETLIVTNQIQLLSELNNMYSLQLHTLEAVVDIEKSKLNLCENFLVNRFRAEGFRRDENRFESYRLMQVHFANNQENYRACVLALDQSIGTIAARNAIFFGYPALELLAQKNRKQELTEVKESIRDSVLPLFRYLDNFAPDSDKDKRTIKGSFFAPSLDFDAMKNKERLLIRDSQANGGTTGGTPIGTHVSPEVQALRNLRPLSTTHFPDTDPSVQFYYSAFEDLRSGEDIITYADYEMKINQYRELAAPGRKRLLNPNELYNHKDTSATAALETAFDWLSLAIAQQAFLSGDALLPFLSKDGFRKYNAPAVSLEELLAPPAQGAKADDKQAAEKVDDKRAALAHYILGHNYLLLQNTLRYRIFSLMDGEKAGKKISAATYTWAWRTQDPFYFNHLFGDSIPIARVERKEGDPPETPPTGWYCKYTFDDYDTSGKRNVRTAWVPLPEPEDVLAKSFVFAKSMQDLLACRERLNTLLAEHQLGFEVSKEPNRLAQLKLLLLIQNYKPRKDVKQYASSGSQE